MGNQRFLTYGFLTGFTLALSTLASAQAGKEPEQLDVTQAIDSVMAVDGVSFSSWQEYASSDLFLQKGLRCGTKPSRINAPLARAAGGQDCTFTFTNPDPAYDPSVVKYSIPVVVHVIRQTDGVTGNISEAMVQSQIAIMNEDFLALPGTNGANGTDIQIEFFLATEKPDGTPTNGITYTDNTTWFNDNGSYWNTLAWDTNRYLNIYTNQASGNLGYVPDLPQGGIAGSNADRVVILWSTFGQNGPFGPPFNLGRTVIHELGHYFGLEHPWGPGGCPTVSGCSSNGDLICDTNTQNGPTNGCFDANSCGTSDSIRNYLDYSDDSCMEEFTMDQARRMRCSLEHYRPNLFTTSGVPATTPTVSDWGIMIVSLLILTCGSLIINGRQRLTKV